jgi:hypothetical protein
MNALIEVIFSRVLISVIFFFAVLISFTYHLLPVWSSKIKKKRKLEWLLFPIVIAIFSAVTGDMIVYVISPQSLSNPIISLALPVSSFAAGYFAKKAFEELKVKT